MLYFSVGLHNFIPTNRDFTMIKRLILLLGIFATFNMYAQPHPDSLVYTTIKWEYIENLHLKIDVNGVPLWSVLNKEQIIEKFGIPDEYYNEDGRYDDAWKERGYKYGSNYIETCDCELWEFYIYDTKFKVHTTYFDGGIGVGDHISVFKGFKDGMLYQRDPKRFGEYCYEIEDSSDGYFCFSTDTKGYITRIWYTFPV